VAASYKARAKGFDSFGRRSSFLLSFTISYRGIALAEGSAEACSYMKIKRFFPLNMTVLALAAVLWQAEVNAQTAEKEAGPRSRGVGVRKQRRKLPVGKRRQMRLRQFSKMRERARLYEPYIAAAARKYGVDPRVLWTIAYLETRFRPELVSPANARGLMQFIPGTAKRFDLTNPHDGPAAIDAAARYVKQIVAQFGGRLDLVLASYNAGEGAVSCYQSGRSLRTSTGKVINPRGIKTSGIPPYRETVSYVKRGLLVFSRVTSAGVFNPELIAATRTLQAPAMEIALSDQRVIDNELRELGGLPATVLYSGMKQIGIGDVAGVRSSLTRNADAASGGFQTVFFDVHSGARYVVSKGEIVRPLVDEATEVGKADSGSIEGVHRVAEKSVYLGAGGE